DVAMTTRPELLELELELLADTTRIALARNDALPQLDASFTYRRNGLGAELEGALNQIYQDEFEDYGFGLTASMPIGNNAAEARIQRALLNRMSRVLTKDARQQTITQDVLDAVERLRSDWQRILAARQAVTLNARTLEAEQRQFTQGISTSVDVLEAAARLASARAEEIRSIADYELAQVALAQATGTVLGRAAIDLGQPERP
ncbi:MAG: TolC family protein, partial [Planctomycetota bacterium]